MTKASVIQMVSGAKINENLALAKNLIAQAAADGADFISLPENFALMAKTEQMLLEVREQRDHGIIHEFLSAQAEKHQVWLLGGTIPLESTRQNRVFAASLLYNRNGVCVACYKKLHLFDAILPDHLESYQESATFMPGNEVVVADTELGKIGLSICYDLRFPELYRKMQQQKVQIITVPSAFTATTGRVHWQTLLQARAIENLCYVIAPNQGGIHENQRKTWGHSMIIAPWGNIIAELAQGTGVITAEIDLQDQALRRRDFPALNHQRIFIS